MSERDVYNALIGRGLTMSEAAGIMGNIQNESSFNPEANAVDSNGLRSLGLVQWNLGSYPNAGSFVTGNFARDLNNQISAIVAEARRLNLSPTNAAQDAGIWASQFERCVGCQAGGAQFNSRVSNANAILGQAKSGNWGSGAGIGGSGTGAQTTGFNPLDPASWVPALINGIPQAFGLPSWPELAQRAGLILLGAALILVGIAMLAGKEVMQVAGTAAKVT